ncbi:MAG: hypothetical protein LH609_00690 [Rudanella sp.]|nr:hypothetical protein [Rudanella sp.]
MLTQLENKIVQLQEHSVELGGAVQRLEREKVALLESNKDLRKKLRELPKKLLSKGDSFTLPTKNGNVVKDNQAGAADNTELKQKLDEYIREIEQVIAHLSTLS